MDKIPKETQRLLIEKAKNGLIDLYRCRKVVIDSGGNSGSAEVCVLSGELMIKNIFGNVGFKIIEEVRDMYLDGKICGDDNE